MDEPSAAARWNPRWARRRPPLDEPTPLIMAHTKSLSVGARVLELASGNGRDTLPLARRGLHVTAVDASDVALDQLAQAAEAEGLAVVCTLLDLQTGALPPGEAFDAIVSANYFQPGLLQRQRVHLKPDGIIIFVQPSTTNLERHARPSARFLVDDDAVDALCAGMLVLHRSAAWRDNGRHEVHLVVRPAPLAAPS